MKNNKSIIINTIFVGLVLIAGLLYLAFGVPYVKQMSGDKKEPYIYSDLSREVNSQLGNAVFSLYSELKKNEVPTTSISELFVDDRNVKKDYQQEVHNQIVETIDGWAQEIKNLQNLDYYVMDTTNPKNSYITNNEELTKLYEDYKNGVTQQWEEKIDQEYCGFLVVSVDDEGNFFKNYYQGKFRKDAFNQLLKVGRNNMGVISSDSGFDEPGYWEIDSAKFLKNPSSTTYVFGVKKNLPHDDQLAQRYFWIIKRVQGLANAFIMFLIVVGIAVLTMLVPYGIEKNMLVVRKLRKMPMELLLAGYWILGSIALFLCYNGFFFLYSGYAAKELADGMFSKTFWDCLMYGGSYIFVVMVFFCAITGFTLIKQVYKNGIRDYLNHKSIIVRGIKRFRCYIRKQIDTVIAISLQDDGKRKLWMIFIAHIAISFLFCWIWFFGAVLCVIYNVLIARYLYQRWIVIQEHYGEIVKATKKMAEGKLDYVIADDVEPFHELKGEMEQIQSGFKKAVDSEVKSQSMKTELISNVSHDLKTPLTTIITYMDLLKSEEVTSAQREEFIQIIDQKANRLKVLIDDLFEMSKATSGNISLNYMNLDLGCLIKQVFLENDEKLKAAELQVRFNIDEKLMVRLDNQKTYRIFENLVCNISKYAMRGSRVYISATLENSMVVTTFRNMSSAEIDYNGDELVERFVRGDKSRNTEGSGLGLGIAKTLTDLQGGSFKVYVDGDLFKVVVCFPHLVK